MTDGSKTADELLSGLTTPDEIAQVEKNSANLARFAKILLSNDRPARAVELAGRALQLAPNDESVASAVSSWSVPDWHFSIVQDRTRSRPCSDQLHHHQGHDRCSAPSAASTFLP